MNKAEMRNDESLEENKTKYKKIFKIPAPQWKSISAYTHLYLLEGAIKTNLSYHTENEEIRLKSENKKIKAEYQKRFGEPITDFELSIMRLNLRGIWAKPYFSIARTATGAIVKYIPKDTRKLFELRLGLEEWLDFVRALRKCNVNEWEPISRKLRNPGEDWRIELLSFGENVSEFSSLNIYSPSWNEFEKAIDNIKAKIKKDFATEQLEAKLAEEYEKKFITRTAFGVHLYGEPITNFELSTDEVVFKSHDQVPLAISVTRTATGAIVKYYLDGYPSGKMGRAHFSIELDIGEWLDFMKDLHECSINEWGKRSYECRGDRCSGHYTTSSRWGLSVFSLDRKIFKESNGYAYPMNWVNFKKAMDKKEKKVKEK
jgi:hypothetical protein